MDLQDLRRRLYIKAKSEPTWRFWGLYVHVCKRETLWEAYRQAKANDGAPGNDGMTFEAVEARGVEEFLDQLRKELVERTYRPQKARKVEIPKGGGKMRQLSIPSIRDRVVQGGSFGFLGFEFRRIRSRRGRWMPLLLPKGKKRMALLSKLREIFRVSHSQPVAGVIEKINPILRGWVKYFAIGHSSRCFSYIRYWVETRIRRHLARACQRQGFGWKRWSREWLYGTLGLFSEYRVSYGQSISAVAPV
jgi:hypothetical protein